MVNKYKVSRGMSAAINKAYHNLGMHLANTLVNIEHLSLLPTSNVSDISIMSQMVNLKYADLDKNKIVDLTPLKDLTKLERLYISNNDIGDLSPLSNLQTLHALSISNLFLVKDFTCLTKLSGLRSLNCRGLHIDPEILSKIPNLENVNTVNETVSDNRSWYKGTYYANTYKISESYSYGFETSYILDQDHHTYNVILYKAENCWYVTIDKYIWMIVGCLDNRKYVMDFLDNIFKKYSTDEFISIIKRKPYIILDDNIPNQLDLISKEGFTI